MVARYDAIIIGAGHNGLVAAALSLLTAVVLALAAAIAYLGPIGAGPAVLAGIWFALLGVGTAASLALVVLYRTRTLTPRNPALASAAEAGAFVGVLFLSVWAVLWPPSAHCCTCWFIA